jgi:broad specificity phosphatase PhoE
MCDPVGRSLAGRRPGVHLNLRGKREAERLAEQLSELALSAIYSSPLERAIETAEPIAARHGLVVRIAQGLNEVDFGDWTGKSLAELDPLPEWKRFNTHRSETRIPGGEGIGEVLSRSQAELASMEQVHSGPAALVAVISHGDVLRAIVASALGMSLDRMQRLELAPASVSILSSEEQGQRILQLNQTGDWPDGLTRKSA